MPRHRTPYRYRESFYDDDDCLKPPVLLWIVIVFLCRGLLLPIVAGIGHYAHVDAGELSMMRDFWRSDELLPAVFAAPVFYALLRRTPAAARPARWIWARGRLLLAAATLTDIGLGLHALRSLGTLDQEAFAALSGCVLDAYFLLYVFMARRVRDTFADFPAPLPSA